ncbi:MAG: type IV pili twitching motility protein PilT [Parcubacteria group bacterium RIFCSPHIGHO2_01_FULL_45_26]|nr:MAG: type IV pili twitching motility protein PilT [Parcubacteria group bacterium RIFCSPHIGHO2_01_FULL_45_26]
MEYKAQLEALIEAIAHEGASDLHLSVGHRPMVRVSGGLIPLVNFPELKVEDTKGLLFEMLSPENKKLFLDSKDLDFAYTTTSQLRFRGNAFYQMGSVGVALRLIMAKIRTVNELRLPPILEEITKKKQGFFLVVGPVGQGKSTTLAAMIDLINNTRSEHIITIEDPIEYIFPLGKSIIDQREVRFDTLDFQSALKSMFRQDVNVAMIGEMRNPETIATAVTAAETGHLIFSTLHTNNAAQTIDRIIDSFPGPQQAQIRVQLAGSLIGVFSQRLLPKVSGGLVPAYELLLNNSAVSNLIREGRTYEINMVLETGAESGMVNMNHSIASLVRAGEIGTEDAFHYSLDQEGLQRLL